MPCRLVLMRHAKSDWSSGAHDDHGRPLNARGRRSAPLVARRLADLGWIPEAVVSSDSTRTRETWALMEDPLGGSPAVRFTSSLYHAGPEQLSVALSALSEDVGTALALGHNPGWSAAVFWLSGEHLELKTADAALLEHDSGWREAASARDWRLTQVIRARDLDA